MAEILTNGATMMLNKLAGAVANEISLAWGVKDDLKKLQNTLDMIRAKIVDAEEQQVKNNELRLWLKRLKDVVYDADDVMDRFSYETMRRRHERDIVKKNKVLNFVTSSSNSFAFRFDMAKKIKDINRRLDVIAHDMGRFQLQTASSDTTTIMDDKRSEQWSRQTTSFVEESKTLGREDDKQEIVKLLTMAKSNQNHENVSVISVVGMGGLGKTTLAQLVYNDELVKNEFKTRMWVCVSEDFDVRSLLLKILESIAQKAVDDVLNADVLAKNIRKELTGKKYLLVLDDLWNENGEQWERLKGQLLVGAPGSKILITTRKDQVASIVRGSIRPYSLKQLPEEICWSIIEQKAFSPGGALKTPNMTNIGKQIARKCSGLPLAAKSLGSLMHSKSNEADWLSVKENDIWKIPQGQSNIMPILRLSYDNLSPHMKQCFSYCSMFPKDWEIHRETLIQLWLAEGFLEPSDAGKSIEDVGNEYFETLVSSSFLGDVKKNRFGDIVTCKMHDLAQAVAENHECASVKVNELKSASEARRMHLILGEKFSRTYSECLSNAAMMTGILNNFKKLRTILLFKGSFGLVPDVLLRNKYLRVLHLGPFSGSTLSPLTCCFSFTWRHLRYLSLSSYSLREVKENQSTNKLYNLQTLVLTECRHVQNFLQNMGALENLRHLNISSTDIIELPESITSLKHLKFLNMSSTPIEHLPDFIIRLRNLQTLDVNSCIKLKALPEYVAGLENLRIFDFKNCPLLNALPINFGALTQLRSLNISGTGIYVLPESCTNLYSIEFVHLFWCAFPEDVKNWTKLREFTYLKEGSPVGIGELVSLEQLSYKVQEKVINKPEVHAGIEELVNLNFLKDLVVYELQNVKDLVDAERANLKGKQNLWSLKLHWGTKGSDMWLDDEYSCHSTFLLRTLQPHTSLRHLLIGDFMGWDLPTWMCTPSSLPNLEKLELVNCKGIKQLPVSIGQLPCLRFLILKEMSLKSLDIELPLLNVLNLIDMFLLEEVFYSYPLLQSLWIRDCKSLIKIPSFTSLGELLLQKIDHELVYSILRTQTSVKKLFLENIEDLIFFSVRVLQNNCNLQVLHFKECHQLQGFGVNDDDMNGNKLSLFGPELHNGFLQRWTTLQIIQFLRCPEVKKETLYFMQSLSVPQHLYVDIYTLEKKGGDPSADSVIDLMEPKRSFAKKTEK